MRRMVMPKIFLLNTTCISNLKRKAKRVAKERSISRSQALHIIAVEVGFSCWKDLINTFKYESSCKELNFVLDTKAPEYERYIDRRRAGENPLFLLKNDFKSLVLSEFTERQKIGSISRIFDLHPSRLKNVIHVHIAEQDDAIFISKEVWESHGLLEDTNFANWLVKNDPYFLGADYGVGLFRLLALDTDDYREISQCIEDIGKRLNLFWGLDATHIWINGKIDPDSLIPEDDDPQYIHQVPLSEVPKSVWRLP